MTNASMIIERNSGPYLADAVLARNVWAGPPILWTEAVAAGLVMVKAVVISAYIATQLEATDFVGGPVCADDYIDQDLSVEDGV